MINSGPLVIVNKFLYKAMCSRIVMAMDDSKMTEVESIAGYTFNDSLLLKEALTHRSFLNEGDGRGEKDNERLEFFGDAILGFTLSELLFQRFPSYREGELTKLRASLVDEESLAAISQRIGLGRHLRLGRGEERSGGREKKSILADAYEAFLAAIYLDGGIDSVRRVVLFHLEQLLEERSHAAAPIDFKTEFQELVQSRFGITPHYRLVNASGPDHLRMFTVSACVGTDCVGEGTGRSKKEAEQAAAREGLLRLRASE